MNLARFKSHFIIFCAAALVAGCAKTNKLASHAPEGGGLQSMHLTSPAFKNYEPIPKEFTADGQDISPPLKWFAGPPQTKQYVLFVEDPDSGGAEPYIHWIVYNIPTNVTELPQGMSSAMGQSNSNVNVTQGQNSKGSNSYVGPEPSSGSKEHRYYFQLFAIGKELNLPAGATKEQVLKAMDGSTLTKGVLVGTYKR